MLWIFFHWPFLKKKKRFLNIPGPILYHHGNCLIFYVECVWMESKYTKLSHLKQSQIDGADKTDMAVDGERDGKRGMVKRAKDT